jgi:hypothetical protein
MSIDSKRLQRDKDEVSLSGVAYEKLGAISSLVAPTPAPTAAGELILCS